MKTYLEPAFPWTETSTPLTQEEAIETFETGRHSMSRRSVIVDVGLREAIRDNFACCALSENGELEIQVTKKAYDSAET